MNNNISVDKDEIYVMILLIAFIFFLVFDICVRLFEMLHLIFWKYVFCYTSGTVKTFRIHYKIRTCFVFGMLKH